ncbi:SIMPL domain-containing protein [Duganella callida]|uniref:DUF541 domain-containing protein n=1 Tax=Duganella callida TaxID=2561932 RepID=A0A4Y9S5Q0_9BURK|nr:SIMPL domain-containing protein [Duganella callida]TFW15793.1 DUF541 domain-containing protein [Duganella callida]
MKQLAAAVSLSVCTLAIHAQSLPTSGALLVVPADGEVRHVNDQATVTLTVEEVDKDKAAAASRVNQKMKQGLEIVRKQDPQASLKTQNYYTYPVYPEEPPLQPGQTRKPRVATAWRVGQSLQVVTTHLDTLPRTVAAAQNIMSLSGVYFSLTPETTKQLEDQRIAATWQNFNERFAAIAKAMGRSPADAVLDTVDFEGSGNYTDRVSVTGARMMAAPPPAPYIPPGVEETSFEPGETTLQMRLVAKVRFK